MGRRTRAGGSESAFDWTEAGSRATARRKDGHPVDSLADRLALVTRAGRGIGRAVALALASGG